MAKQWMDYIVLLQRIDFKIFESEEFGSVRIVEVDRKPYFVGNDVAKALGFTEIAASGNECIR
ncbi:MAG: hypothetical protein HFG28_09510 [Eubacterium sp.]|nr:hypothetical protein [Eubacterium sp.]